MMRRSLLLCAGAAGGLAATRTRSAQTRLRRLGVLLFDGPSSWEFLRRDLGSALGRMGWEEGRNLESDWRFAEDDPTRLPVLAEALLRDGADVLLTRGTPATRALQLATRRVPIATGVGDPIGAGFAASLAAPGGNITGLSYAAPELTLKQIQLLHEMVPHAKRLIVLLPDSRRPLMGEFIQIVERSARSQGLAPKVVTAAGLEALRLALRSARGVGDAAAFVFSFGASIEPRDVAAAILQAGLAAVYDQRAYVDAGGLMSYRLDWDDQTQSAAAQLDKLLRGTPPAQLPFELPTRSELVLNARTAKALGLAIPIALRARADDVIE